MSEAFPKFYKYGNVYVRFDTARTIIQVHVEAGVSAIMFREDDVNNRDKDVQHFLKTCQFTGTEITQEQFNSIYQREKSFIQRNKDRSNLLRITRENRNLTQEYCAGLVGLSQGEYSRVENGKRHVSDSIMKDMVEKVANG